MTSAEQERGRRELVSGLSTRFVELRRRAGMTQQAVADAMGKSRTGRRLVGKLERRGLERASLGTVAEYLRAVRAGFRDLKDVLDHYTSLPIPEPARKQAEAAPLPRVSSSDPNLECVQRRAAALPEKRELCSRTPKEEPDIQVLRIRRRAGYWALRRLFEFYVHTGLNSASIPPYVRFRRIMAAHARRVFNALYRTHRAKEAKRAEWLARLRASAEKQALDRTIVEYSESIARLAYDEMREHDELDWMPPSDEAFAIMAVKPKHRVVTDAQMCLAEWWEVLSRYSSAAQEVHARAHKAATDVAAAARCDERTAFRYKLAVNRAANIASFTAPDTKERKRSVADFNATDWPPDMDRKLLAWVLAAAIDVWDASRPTLPPAPGPRPG